MPATKAGIAELWLDDLVATMRDDEGERAGNGDLETLFVRLLDDHARGELPTTLAELTTSGVNAATSAFGRRSTTPLTALTLPVEVVRQSRIVATPPAVATRYRPAGGTGIRREG